MLKLARTCFAVFLLLLVNTQLFPQTTTEGKEFWLGFMQNELGGPPVFLEIYISSRQTSQVTVEAPLGDFKQTVTVSPGSTEKVVLPTSEFMPLKEGIKPIGLRVTSDNFVSVYALNKRQSSADATVVLPTTALGKEYIVTAHMEPPGDIIPSSRESNMLIVATEDNTQVEVITTVDTYRGLKKGESNNVTLNAGETYQIKSREDLTGTIVRSVSSNNTDCKKVAVFGGNVFTNVGGCGDARDHLFEQMFPLSTWGQNFLYVPYETRLGGDYIKILAAFDNTKVTLTGGIGTITLDAGESYINKAMDGVRKITSDKPISFSQFSRSRSCDKTNSDPFYIVVSPLEQRIQQATFHAFDVEDIDRYFLTLIKLSSDESDVLLDGVNIKNRFSSFQAAAYASIEIQQGSHTLEAPDGVIAFIYGYGSQESFGYSAGVALENLNVKIELGAENASPDLSEICINETIDFSVFIKAGPDVPDYSIFEWDLGDGNKAYGAQINHQYKEPGEYEVFLLASDGLGNCSTQDLIARKFIVKDSAPEELVGPQSVCPATEGVVYQVTGDEGNSYSWGIEGGVIVSSSVGSTVTVNWGDSNENAALYVVTTNSLGCEGERVTFPIRVNPNLQPAIPQSEGSNHKEVCFSDRQRVKYFTPKTPGSSYQWFVNGGSFTPDTDINSNEVFIDWGNSSFGEVWYREFNEKLSDCEGFSDKLQVKVLKEVTVSPEVFDVLCKGESNGSIVLNIAGGKGGAYEVTWDNGMQGESISGLSSGNYIATVTDELGCSTVSSIYVNEPDPLFANIEVIPSFCYQENSGGAKVEVQGGTPFQAGNYSFLVEGNGVSNVFSSGDISGLGKGEYTITITDRNGCSISQNIEVSEPSPLQFDMEAFIKVPVCPDESNGRTFIDAKGGTPDYSFYWSNNPNVASTEGSGFAKGTYTVKLVDSNGCEKSMTFDISEREPRIFIPNAFSPNNDGENDIFMPQADCSSGFMMQVYNKWGAVVYTTTNVEEGWDGTYLGKPAAVGNYSYLIFYSGVVNNRPFEETYRGSFNLIR